MHSTVNGISINFEIDGPEGAPWLVFSNSLLTNLSMWDDQVAELKQSYRCLRYDQRGHGGTQATEGHYSFDLLVADIIALLDMLGIKRAHFCGLSMGGMTALYWRSAIPGASIASSPAIAGRPPRRPRRNSGRSVSSSRPRTAWRPWSRAPLRAGFRRNFSPPNPRSSTISAR